jgi:hypothetical protein
VDAHFGEVDAPGTRKPDQGAACAFTVEGVVVENRTHRLAQRALFGTRARRERSPHLDVPGVLRGRARGNDRERAKEKDFDLRRSDVRFLGEPSFRGRSDLHP